MKRLSFLFQLPRVEGMEGPFSRSPNFSFSPLFFRRWRDEIAPFLPFSTAIKKKSGVTIQKKSISSAVRQGIPSLFSL